MSLNINMADGTVVMLVLSVSLVFINLSTVIFVKAIKNWNVNFRKTCDELTSAQFIIDLLVRDVNFAKASMGASKNRYQCKYNDADFSSHESNRAGINNWIPVKNIHSYNNRHKNTQQSNSLITLSNSFAVLGNLCESSDKATTNILKVHKAFHVQRNRPKLQRNTLFC